MAETVADGPVAVAVNTDASALAKSRATTKLQIGAGHTGGLGTGGDVSLGRLSARDDVEMIRGVFDDVDLGFLVVGLGGGSGTGAAPVVLGAACDAGAMTLCFATLPFEFEGAQRRTQADEAIDSIREACDALIVIPNDRLFESVGQTSVRAAFRKADEVLSAAICAIWKLIIHPGFINLDFADLKKVVQNSGGVCAVGHGDGTGKNKAKAAVASLLKSPLLEHGEVIARARSLLVSIVGGPDLALKEIGDIMDALSSAASEGCHVSMGTVIDDGLGDRVTLTVLAAEEWAVEPLPELAVSEPNAQAKSSTGPARRRRRRSGPRQTKLKLDLSGKGRFKNVEPTILDGEDLDIPAFLRRGISIEK